VAVLTAAELADIVREMSGGRLDSELRGRRDVKIEAVAPLSSAGPGRLSFLANSRYRGQVVSTRAAAVVLDPRDADELFGDAEPSTTLVACTEPYAWFAYAAQHLAPPSRATSAGVSDGAHVHLEARVDASARVDEFAVVSAGAQVGAGAWIQAGAYVGAGASVGERSRLYPQARLLDDCRVGARCIVHSGVVIGADGFGFAPLDGRWIKIPQTGRVLIGDDVEIGANSTIDRGAMDDTVVEDGVKIDNQVQIGHNCRIGAHTAIAGCVGIAGSTVIGRRCQLGGASMIQGHISICDDVVVSGGTAITHSIAAPGFYSGLFPFMRNRDWERNAALVRHLVELRERLRRLEMRIPEQPTGNGNALKT
jgi:UDP-3-O-[3-hydroxymyristoyl] glucosamine N-acyltransferase